MADPVDEAGAEIERLRATLKPFADYAKTLVDVNWVPPGCPVVADPTARGRTLLVEHLRNAQAVLED